MKFQKMVRVAKKVNSVLFVTSQLRQREIKMAFALRSLGWFVGLIYCDITPFSPENHFDYIYKVSSATEAYNVAKKLSPKLVHVFSGAIDDYIMLFCRQKIAPVIIDLNDIFAPSLMDYCTERFSFTQEALALADGFCARDLQVKYAEKLDKYKIPSSTVLYSEYCWNKEMRSIAIKSPHDIHIVSVGTISLETQGMYDCCYLELVKMITDNEVHFHMYPAWCYRNDFEGRADFGRDYADFIKLEKTNPYFHLHDSVSADRLADELCQYDFGIIAGGCSAFGQKYTHVKPEYVESCYSGRISDFLDAKLPILINEEVKYNFNLLKRYGVCIDLKSVMQTGFKAELINLKSDMSLKKKVDAAAYKLSIKENAQRLANFYSKLIYKATIKSNKISFNIPIKNLMVALSHKMNKILTE